MRYEVTVTQEHLDRAESSVPYSDAVGGRGLTHVCPLAQALRDAGVDVDVDWGAWAVHHDGYVGRGTDRIHLGAEAASLIYAWDRRKRRGMVGAPPLPFSFAVELP